MPTNFRRKAHVVGHRILSRREPPKWCVASKLCALLSASFYAYLLPFAHPISHLFPIPPNLCICIHLILDADISPCSAMLPFTTRNQWPFAGQSRPRTHTQPILHLAPDHSCDSKRYASYLCIASVPLLTSSRAHSASVQSRRNSRYLGVIMIMTWPSMISAGLSTLWRSRYATR